MLRSNITILDSDTKYKPVCAMEAFLYPLLEYFVYKIQFVKYDKRRCVRVRLY